MKRFLSFILSTAILFWEGQVCADDSVEKRSYASAVSGLTLNSDQIDYIKRYDQFIFGSETDLFIGLGKEFHYSRRKDIHSFYAGSISYSLPYVRGNHRALSRFLRGLEVGKAINDAEVQIFGLPGPVDEFSIPEINGLLIDTIDDKEDGCKIIRKSENYEVKNTYIILEIEEFSELDVDGLVNVFSCVNRGHFFHFGFSGVRAMAKGSFAKFNYEKERVFLPVESSVYLFRFMATGNFNGKSRNHVLREIAEKLAASESK